MNGTIFDSIIADPYFGFVPIGKMLPEDYVDMTFVLAFVKEPEDYDAPIEELRFEYEFSARPDFIRVFSCYRMEHFMDTMLLKNLHALAWHY